MTAGARAFRSKILRQRTAAHSPGLASDAALMTSRDLFALGPGLVSLRGDVLRLYRFFEHTFLALARRFGADDCHFPVILPAKLLEDVGYFGHFPQHVTFCSHFPHDLPLLEDVARDATSHGGAISEPLRRRVDAATHALQPAVCLPCYPQHRDRIIATGEHLAVTMQNHVFRRETAGYESLSRLWDFQVRDLVLMGSYPQLVAARHAVMDATMELCETLDLTARLELANDPFFLDPSAHKAVYQRLGEVKYELVLPIAHRDLDLAVSSFNLHRTFYASVYNIRQAGGELAETACMGFGLERWVYGFLGQKGMDRRDWPPPVAAWFARSD